MAKHVIIGGDAAGMSAAMTIRRSDENAEILAFEKGETFSYAQCGLPYYIGGQISNSEKLIARKEEEFNEKYQIQARSLHEVVSISPEHKTIMVKNLRNNSTFQEAYDKLLIATGASPIKPEWTNTEGVFPLKTIPDAERIKSYIKEKEVKQAMIVGAGYIGLEMSEAFVDLGIDVTMIQKGDHLGGGLDKEMTEPIEEYLKTKVEIQFSEEVETIKKEGEQLTLISDKNSYETDMIIVAIGVVPNSQIAQAAGIETTERGPIIVNSKMETNIPDIYAAGDCAVQYHKIKEKNDYIPLGTHANKQGKIAGANMAGGVASFSGMVGTSIFKVMDLDVARTGLTEVEAEKEGIPYKKVTIRAYNHAAYYPDATKLHIKLVYRSDNHQLLGGQFVGQSGVDKQVDVLATALLLKLTVEQLLELDLAYAPPYSSTWSPLQQAARMALK